jgi:hypothetical protein
MQKATRKFIAICRDEGSEKVKAAAIEYASEVELHINAMDSDLAECYATIRALREDINLHVCILKAYGVDLNRLAGRSKDAIMSIVDFGNNGIYSVPERLITRL